MKKIILVVAILVFATSMAYAGEGCKACCNLKSDNMQTLWGGRICNGLSNVAFGWSEIFFRPGKVAAGGRPLRSESVKDISAK